MSFVPEMTWQGIALAVSSGGFMAYGIWAMKPMMDWYKHQNISLPKDPDDATDDELIAVCTFGVCLFLSVACLVGSFFA